MFGKISFTQDQSVQFEELMGQKWPEIESLVEDLVKRMGSSAQGVNLDYFVFVGSGVAFSFDLPSTCPTNSPDRASNVVYDQIRDHIDSWLPEIATVSGCDQLTMHDFSIGFDHDEQQTSIIVTLVVPGSYLESRLLLDMLVEGLIL